MSARLYFNLVGTDDYLRDREGVEVFDVRRAKAEAEAMVHELRLSDASTAEAWSGWTLNATDNAGRVLFSIPLVEEAAGRARKTGSGINPRRRVHGSNVARLPLNLSDNAGGVLFPFDLDSRIRR